MKFYLKNDLHKKTLNGGSSKHFWLVHRKGKTAKWLKQWYEKVLLSSFSKNKVGSDFGT